MSSLQVIARFSIHEGKLDEFKTLAEQCMLSVREKDSGTQQYDWYLSADESRCVVIETYRDSAALMEHIGNLGDLLEALSSIAGFQVEIFGEPSDELLAATAAQSPPLYSTFLSI
jgi:quinol monooxygenase YgiN